MAFIHLRVKSAYSLLEGAVRPGELARLARSSQMPAVAVTDTNNLFGVYEIADTLAKEHAQLWINHDKPQSDAQKKAPDYYE